MTFAPTPRTTLPPGCRCPQCRHDAWRVAIAKYVTAKEN